MIDKLELLLALAREEHFGRAAELCGISQQGLSAGLKQLEARLGVLLVRRGSRFGGFTPEGERVLAWARRIVADSRAMREEVKALKRGLSGLLRLAVIPTALPAVVALTTPYRERHPNVRFSVRSSSSVEILALLDDLEIDAGLTYLDNEPLGRVAAVPIYQERYRFVTSPAGPLADRREVTWAEAGAAPLCLLSGEMQNRRIVDGHLRAAGCRPDTVLESNSTVVLLTHVRAGAWASILPAALAETLGPGTVRLIPIVEPEVSHTVGLVCSPREPAAPMVAALVAIARQVAQQAGISSVPLPA